MKKNDSLKLKRERNNFIENKTVLVREMPPHIIKTEDTYRNAQKKAHDRHFEPRWKGYVENPTNWF